jgi:hypothetical protein
MKPEANLAAGRAGEALGALAVKPDAEVVSQRLGEELVIVHLRTNQIFILNRTAARFWELLESGSAIASIEEVLLQEFNVNQDELKRELERFVDSLSSEELVNVGPRT